MFYFCLVVDSLIYAYVFGGGLSDFHSKEEWEIDVFRNKVKELIRHIGKAKILGSVVCFNFLSKENYKMHMSSYRWIPKSEKETIILRVLLDAK